jgi:hypothetical protein
MNKHKLLQKAVYHCIRTVSAHEWELYVVRFALQNYQNKLIFLRIIANYHPSENKHQGQTFAVVHK